MIGRGDRAARPLLGMLRRGLALVPAGGAFSLVENEDLAGLLLLAAERGERARPDGPPGQGVYYAAADEPLALGELARRLALAAGLPARVLRLPLGLVWLLSLGGEGLGRLLDRPLLLNLDKAREARAGSWVCSPEKARRQLGWTPTPLARHLAQAPGCERPRLAARSAPAAVDRAAAVGTPALPVLAHVAGRAAQGALGAQELAAAVGAVRARAAPGDMHPGLGAHQLQRGAHGPGRVYDPPQERQPPPPPQESPVTPAESRLAAAAAGSRTPTPQAIRSSAAWPSCSEGASTSTPTRPRATCTAQPPRRPRTR